MLLPAVTGSGESNWVTKRSAVGGATWAVGVSLLLLFAALGSLGDGVGGVRFGGGESGWGGLDLGRLGVAVVGRVGIDRGGGDRGGVGDRRARRHRRVDLDHECELGQRPGGEARFGPPDNACPAD